MQTQTQKYLRNRPITTNPKLPDLSGPSSFFGLAESQWNFSARLQCNVLDVQHVRNWWTRLHGRRAGWRRLVRILWCWWAFMLQHASTGHSPQLWTLPWLLFTPSQKWNQCILKQKWRNHSHTAQKVALIFVSLTLSARHKLTLQNHCIARLVF